MCYRLNMGSGVDLSRPYPSFSRQILPGMAKAADYVIRIPEKIT